MSTILRPAFLAALFLPLLPGCRRGGGGGGGAGSVSLTKVSLLTRQEISAFGRGLRSFLAADLTGDGAPEIFVSSLIDKKIVYMVASPAAVFSVKAGFQKTYKETPGALRSGDLDKDGDLDVACLFENAGRIRIFRNNGLGGLTEEARTISLPGKANDLALADVDGDGRADLIVTAGAKVHIFVSLPVGGFSPWAPLDAGAGSDLGGIAVGDLDGDGWNDLAVTDTPKDRIHIWKGSKAGFVSSGKKVMASLGRGPISIRFDDLDGDMDLDCLVGNYGAESLAWFPGDGKGGFGAGIQLKLDGDPFHVNSGDLDKDGLTDLVVSYLDRAAVGVLKGLGGGRFSRERQFGTTGLPTESRLVDLDRDGNVDILTSGLNASHLSWMRGLESGRLIASENFATGHRDPSFVLVEDLDVDGRADAIVSDRVSGSCTILLGSSEGRLQKVLDFQVGAMAGSMSRGDFDKDGRPDVVVAVSGGLRFLLNRNSGGKLAFDVFPPINQKPFSAGIGPFEVVSLEADGDSVPDLLVADYGGNKIHLLKGSGKGFGFSSPYPPVPLAGGPLSLVVHDFNKDGKLDFAVSRFKMGIVSVFTGDGKGGFVKAADLAAGDRPNYLRHADFDGNGFEDLVVSNLGGTELTLWLGFSSGFRPSNLKVGDGPTALLARDLNRDGWADLLVANADSADFHVLLGDGKGGFPNIVRIPGSMKSLSADMGDVDGDGLADVLVASLFTNRVSLFLNQSR